MGWELKRRGKLEDDLFGIEAACRLAADELLEFSTELYARPAQLATVGLCYALMRGTAETISRLFKLGGAMQ